MKLTIYKKFEAIPIKEKAKNDIPIFATQQYADYLKETKSSKTMWINGKINESTNYLIPLAIAKKGSFKKGTFLTAVISLGIKNTIEIEKEFLNEIVAYIKKNNLCDWIEQCPNWAVFNTYPDGAIYAPFGTYRINLKEKTEEELFRGIERRVRQSILKALHEKIEIKKNKEYTKDSIDLIEKTLKIGKITGFTHKKYDALLKTNFVNFTSYLDKVPQSSVVFLYNSFSVYAMYAGSMAHAVRGATVLLYWEAIKEFKKRNIKYFDFVGARINPNIDSKLYRIQKFKQHLGPELYEGFLWKIVINKRRYYTYKMYIRIMNNIKGKINKGDIIDQEIKRLGIEKNSIIN